VDGIRTCATHDESKDVWRSYGSGGERTQRVSPEGREEIPMVQSPVTRMCDQLVTFVTPMLKHLLAWVQNLSSYRPRIGSLCRRSVSWSPFADESRSSRSCRRSTQIPLTGGRGENLVMKPHRNSISSAENLPLLLWPRRPRRRLQNQHLPRPVCPLV